MIDGSNPLAFDGLLSGQRVRVIGETRTFYRIQAIERTAIGVRWLARGETALVQKASIKRATK